MLTIIGCVCFGAAYYCLSKCGRRVCRRYTFAGSPLQRFLPCCYSSVADSSA